MKHCIDEPCPGAEFPSGMGLEWCQSIHAEQNALMHCADIFKIEVCYVSASPCMHCVKMLLNTTCKLIMFGARYPGDDRCRDLWQADGTRGWELFNGQNHSSRY